MSEKKKIMKALGCFLIFSVLVLFACKKSASTNNLQTLTALKGWQLQQKNQVFGPIQK